MAKKEKKPLNSFQKKTKYRLLEKAVWSGEFVSITTPYIIMGAINFDEWFRTTEGWKVGLGGSLAIALMCLAVFAITKKKEDKDSKTGGYVTLLLCWLAVAFIFLLLANIMHDIASIMFFGAIGIGGALGLDITSKKFAEKANLYEEAIKEVKKDIVKEEVKKDLINQESEDQHVKIKITK